ncbi:MAG: hypothetical protein Q7R79_03040 [bacterium]|nr:hypothetical protein [bacterium]
MKKNKKQDDFFDLYQTSIQEDAPEEEEDRAVIPPSRLKKAGGKSFIGFFLFIGIAATLAWLGYHFFGGLSANKQFASISIDAPLKVPSGSEVTYTITLENKDDRPLMDTSLLVEFPPDFQFVRSDPEPKNTDKNFWKFGMIPGNQKTTLSLTGVLIGKKDDKKTITAEFHYTPANITSEFILRKSFTTIISSSLLSIMIEGPNQIMPGKEISYGVTYPDFSLLKEKELVTVRINIPDGFTVTGSRPKPHIEGEWTSDILLSFLDTAKRTGSITLTGTYGDAVSGTQLLSAHIGFLRDGVFTSEQEQTYSTQLVRGDLEIALLVNGSSEHKPLAMGDVVDFTVSYAHKGSEPIRNASFKAVLSCPCLDWKTLIDSHSGIFSDGTITWTDKQIPDLSLLVPGARGEIRFSIRTKKASELSGVKDISGGGPLILESYFTASFDQDSASGPQHMESKSGSVKNALNTDMIFQSYGRYYNDEQKAVGSGPIQPKVGQTTTYRVYWTVTNSLHEIQDVIISGALPSNVQWVDHYDRKAGDVRYDPQSREVMWTLNRMPTSIHTISAQFDIQITPQGVDNGTVMPLLIDTEIIAKDAETGAIIRLKEAAITTNIETDPIAGGKGVIGE